LSAAEQLGPIPLIVGAVGHRDLRPADREATEKLVREFLESLKARYRHTPIVLLTCLNEGADRLVAKTALAAGARLIVPMPLMQPLYENDFESAESKTEFRELIRQADQRFTMPLLEGLTTDALREPGPQRDKQNALVGAWIAQQCDYLIALWDGVDRKLVGHPPHIIDMRLNGVPEPYAKPRTILDVPETGPVLHIRVARTSKPGPAEPPSSAMAFPKTMENEAAAHAVFDRVEEFNREALREPAAPQIVPEKTLRVLPESAQRAARTQSQAQAVAARLDAAARKRKSLGPILALAAFFVLVVYVFFAPLVRVLLLPVAALLGAACYYEVKSRHDPMARCAADARALSEALRAQFFWKIAGVEDSAENSFLRRRAGDWQWIRKALRASNLPITGEKATGTPDGPQLALDHWLKAAAPAAAPTADPNLFTVPLTAIAAILSAGAAVAALSGIDSLPAWLLGGVCLALGAAAFFRILSAARREVGLDIDLPAAASRMEVLLSRHDPGITRRFLRDVGREYLTAVEQRLVAERGK
jgi:hypothetical protein